MDPRARQPFTLTVSNLVPVWEEPVAADGGGTFEPAEAATVVERIVHPEAAPERARLVTPPEHFDPAEAVERPSAFAYDLLDEADDTWAERSGIVPAPAAAPQLQAPVQAPAQPQAVPTAALPAVDYDDLRRRDIARELLRARLVALAEQREHRSAYELTFLMLAAAVAILLAAPPLVQVLLAARGIQT